MSRTRTESNVQIDLTRAHDWNWHVAFSGHKPAVKQLIAQLLDGVPSSEYAVCPGGRVLLVRHRVLYWFGRLEPALAAAFREAMQRPWPTQPAPVAVPGLRLLPGSPHRRSRAASAEKPVA